MAGGETETKFLFLILPLFRQVDEIVREAHGRAPIFSLQNLSHWSIIPARVMPDEHPAGSAKEDEVNSDDVISTEIIRPDEKETNSEISTSTITTETTRKNVALV